MHLKDIEINGFRGIKHLKMEDFGTINLIVGKNNACKTSILEALILLVGVSNPSLAINNSGGLLINKEDDFRFILAMTTLCNPNNF
ncbi:MAG: AAA family ATPase [Bacteroidota bacterium]